MSAALDFLSRLIPPVRRLMRESARLREERASLKAARDQARAERDVLREKLALTDAARPLTYHRDGLATIHDAGFLRDPEFCAAYAAGVAATGEDYGWQWRVHVGLWAARHAASLDGDFVECGVNRGFLSAAITHALRWEEEVRKTFFLLDTFQGLVAEQVSEAERALGRRAGAGGRYADCYEQVCATFSRYPNVRIVRGAVPGTLEQVKAARVAYLSIDMNCAAPEIAAGEFFWPRLVPGAVVLLDDYAYAGYTPQKEAWDDFARRHATQVLTLPTGQGLILKS
jgi:hypothetical protein